MSAVAAPRTPLIAGNWKMNLNHLEAIQLVQKLDFALPRDYYDHVDVAVIPPFTDLRSVQTIIDGDKLLMTYGAQDVSAHPSGAYTGEISAAMLAKLGCTWTIVGHSERRQYHLENDDTVAKKAIATLAAGMSPIVCVGESLEVRQAGEQVEVVAAQTRASLTGIPTDQLDRVVIAYEPVWAIGTGKVASAGDAQEVCHTVRDVLRELGGDAVADRVRVLYGGSVKTETVAEIITQPDVDGALVGGASLNGEEFARLCAAAAKAAR